MIEILVHVFELWNRRLASNNNELLILNDSISGP